MLFFKVEDNTVKIDFTVLSFPSSFRTMPPLQANGATTHNVSAIK